MIGWCNWSVVVSCRWSVVRWSVVGGQLVGGFKKIRFG